MQITTPASSHNIAPKNCGITTKRSEEKRAVNDSKCTGKSRFFSDCAHQLKNKALPKYNVSHLVFGALKSGRNVTRTVAGFAFRQVMNSPYIGVAAPGLKESMLVFFMLYNQLKPTQATAHECESNQFPCESGDQCVLDQLKCDGKDHCADKSDENPELCNANLTTTEEPISEFNATEGAMPEFRNTEDSESSSPSMGWVAVPVVLTFAAVGVCTYKSYQVLRREDQESSKGQLICKALRHPLHFCQPKQPAAILEAIEINHPEQDDQRSSTDQLGKSCTKPSHLKQHTVRKLSTTSDSQASSLIYKAPQRQSKEKSSRSQLTKKPFVKIDDSELSKHLLTRNIQDYQPITTSKNTV